MVSHIILFCSHNVHTYVHTSQMKTTEMVTGRNNRRELERDARYSIMVRSI